MKIIASYIMTMALLCISYSTFAQNRPYLTGISVLKTTDTRNAYFPNLEQYLSEKLQYPELAQKNGVEGHVMVEALISEEGDVLSVGLFKGIGFGCDKAVLQLVSNMPKWAPAIKNGKRVQQKVFISANFWLK